MRTTKPIATISFNTPDFLKLKLNELLKAGRLSFWAFIVHKPEDDEGGKKVHCHLYVEPSKMLQTDDLKAELKEYDPDHPDTPRGCISFNSSKFDPWYLYALHDKRYLASKGQSRKFHYEHDNIVSSDDDDLIFKARSIDMISLSPYADMEDAQRQGLSFAEYFRRGTVPLPQVVLFERAWNLMLQAYTDRADREGHPMDVDTDTGEVLNTSASISLDSSEKCSQSPSKAPQSPKELTWCGATRNEWKALYENATSDSEWLELSPEDDMPF